MQIGRRQFLKYCIGSAAALGLDLTVLGKLEKALAAEGPAIIWLNASNCTGCTVSLANRFSTQEPVDIADLLINVINLAYHPNLMGAAGDQAVAQIDTAVNNGGYILAVDGGIPTRFGGRTCYLWTDKTGHEETALEAVRRLASEAAQILSIGTCASFGGIPASGPNPTGIESLSQATGRSTINIPGCPTHPDWVVLTVAQLLSGSTPSLDSYGRPSSLFSGIIHNRCPRRERSEVQTFGIDGGCLERLGCKGPRTRGDCPSRKWNSGTNWCIGANAICLGCTERGFPDSFSPFYTLDYSYENPSPSDPAPDSEPAPEPTPEPPGPVLIVTNAEWNSRRRNLIVAGSGPAGALVRIRNADTREVLGLVEIESDHTWQYVKRTRRNDTVPCRVRCELRDSTSNFDIGRVRNAPNCSDDYSSDDHSHDDD